MPSSMREWIIERKVWLSTAGKPPSTIFGILRSSVARPRCITFGDSGTVASKGTNGFRHNIRSTPWSSATEACIVFLRAPST